MHVRAGISLVVNLHAYYRIYHKNGTANIGLVGIQLYSAVQFSVLPSTVVDNYAQICNTPRNFTHDTYTAYA